MTAEIQNYLSCDADFDKDGGWIGDLPDESRPPGRDLIEVLRSALIPDTSKASEIWNEEGYGWSFNCERNGITINVLVQFSERWLIICSVVTLKPRFLRSARYDAALLSVRDIVDCAVIADIRFRNPHWFTAAEYVQFERQN